MTDSELFGPSDLPVEFGSFLGSVRGLSYPPQGCTSQVAVVNSSRGRFVVKRAQGEQFCDWLAREEHVLRSLATSGLPIPRPRGFLPATPEGESWLLMDFLPGETIGRVLTQETDASTRSGLLRAFGQILRTIHQTPPPPALPRAGRHWLDAMLDEAADNLARFPVDGSPALLDWLRQHRPLAVPQMLIHGDFTLDNVLVQERRVTGVIDWSNGALGDPRYDLALATRPDEGIFSSADDPRAFFVGYGGDPLSAEIQEYFVRLYEFF